MLTNSYWLAPTLSDRRYQHDDIWVKEAAKLMDREAIKGIWKACFSCLLEYQSI
jgi:hypothetical protein